MKGFLSRTGARLKRKLGPLPVWVWVSAALVGLVVWRRRHAGTSSTSSSTDSTGAVGSTDPGGSDYWTGQPSGYSSGGGGGSSTGSGDPGGGADPTTSPGSKTGTGFPSGTNPGGPEQKPPGKKKPRIRVKPPKVGHHKPHKKSGHTKPPKPKGRTKTHKAKPRHPHDGGAVARPARALAAHAEPPKSRPAARVQPARHTGARHVSFGVAPSHHPAAAAHAAAAQHPTAPKKGIARVVARAKPKRKSSAAKTTPKPAPTRKRRV